VTQRLAGIAAKRWGELDGYAVAHRLGYLGDLTVPRFGSFVWWFLTRDGSAEDIEKFRVRLWRPPPRVVPTAESPWSAANETAAFAGLKAAFAPKK
jgi:hypothetical protein